MRSYIRRRHTYRKNIFTEKTYIQKKHIYRENTEETYIQRRHVERYKRGRDKDIEAVYT